MKTKRKKRYDVRNLIQYLLYMFHHFVQESVYYVGYISTSWELLTISSIMKYGSVTFGYGICTDSYKAALCRTFLASQKFKVLGEANIAFCINIHIVINCIRRKYLAI